MEIEKMSEISFNDSVRATADLLKKEMSVGDQGIVTISEDVFEKTLPEGLTMTAIKEMQDHRDLVIAGTGLALGELGTEALKGDKELKQLSVSYKMNKDKINGIFYRTKDHAQPTGGMATKPGVLQMGYKAYGQAGGIGQLKKVKAHLSEMAKEVLSS